MPSEASGFLAEFSVGQVFKELIERIFHIPGDIVSQMLVLLDGDVLGRKGAKSTLPNAFMNPAPYPASAK